MLPHPKSGAFESTSLPAYKNKRHPFAIQPDWRGRFYIKKQESKHFMKKVLILSANNFEDTELLVPYYRLREAGFDVTVSTLKGLRITGKHGYEVKVDKLVSEVDADAFDALVLPGGKAPAELRKSEDVLEIARRFDRTGKPIAAICHGPQVLISAGLLNGRKSTCYPKVAPELERAGARYEDRDVVVDANLITSRRPADLPAFMREFMKKLSKGIPQEDKTA